MSKSKIEKRQVGTKADSSTKTDVTTSSQTIAKPNVVCSQSQSACVEPINKEDMSKLIFDNPLNVGTITLYEQELKYCPPFGQSTPT
jgi:hypothetical protein